jgi:hypothetical protein
METALGNEPASAISPEVQGGSDGGGDGVAGVSPQEVAIVARMYLKRTLTGFVPSDQPSLELMRKLKVGDVYRADVVKPRSYQHHKLCMALLSLTFENLPERYSLTYPTFDMFRYAVAKEAGHCEAFVDLQGEITTIPKSISYDAIPDDVEFGKIMASMMTICANILHVEQPILELEVARYADEHYGRAA